MPTIKLPTTDANGMTTGYADYTTTNNTAYGNRRSNRALSSPLYPLFFTAKVTQLEP